VENYHFPAAAGAAKLLTADSGPSIGGQKCGSTAIMVAQAPL